MSPRQLFASISAVEAVAAVAAVAAVTSLAALGGCVTSTGPATPRAAASPVARAAEAALRVNNGSLDRLDVYVVEDMREWFLGRVEPGAVVRLSLPADVHVAERTMVRLAVLANAPRSGHPSRTAGVVVTVWQPLARLLAQDWLFAQGQLMGAAGRPGR